MINETETLLKLILDYPEKGAWKGKSYSQTNAYYIKQFLICHILLRPIKVPVYKTNRIFEHTKPLLYNRFIYTVLSIVCRVSDMK